MTDRDRASTRGAIYVEFLVAFLPVFTMFLGLVQLMDLHQANLVVHHAAFLTARSAAVVLPDDPQYYNNVDVGKVSDKRKDDILKAASFALRASRSLSEVKVTFPSSPGGSDDQTSFNRGDLIRVQIQAHFECRVPLVSNLVCGSNSIRTLTAESAFPNQGADFTY